MPPCALCTTELTPTDGVRFLDGEYRICERCDSERPVERFGPERAYEGAGPTIGRIEMETAMRKVMGDDEFERLRSASRRIQLVPALPEDEQIWRSYQRENARLHHTGVKYKNKQAIRKAAANADAVEVRRVKRK